MTARNLIVALLQMGDLDEDLEIAVPGYCVDIVGIRCATEDGPTLLQPSRPLQPTDKEND